MSRKALKAKLPAIIFDMDGVITDTVSLHKNAELQVCRELGLNPPESERVKSGGHGSRFLQCSGGKNPL
jgi:beta-phosphoglucomutase-like phosphatase (HAD superfamily)